MKIINGAPQSGVETPVTHHHAGRLTLALMGILTLGLVPFARAQTYKETVLHSFTGAPDGRGPEFGALVRNAAGTMYGTTIDGGAFNYGTVFKVSPAGKEAVLHSFAGQPDGKYPHDGLILDSAGNLYGATFDGGAFGYGTVFKLSAAGVETVLYNFTGQPDGDNPDSGLTRDSAGNLYGTTFYGGTSNNGAVFKLSATGLETVLHSFAGPPSDGAIPYAGLVRDSAGNLYGVTVDGGSDGDGTVFKLATTAGETLLDSFSGQPAGKFPHGILARAAAGATLYGTTLNGGASGFGMVFSVTPAGAEQPLYSFTGAPDGQLPIAGVVVDAHGNLYGTTQFGGVFGFGSVYRLTSTGQETILYSFAGPPDGESPIAALILDARGNLYGTTVQGGASNAGTVFRLSPQ